MVCRCKSPLGISTTPDTGLPQIHRKVWGHELWIVNNGKYCGKRMVLLRGWQCSLHYHKIKEETFYIESGLVRMELGDRVLVLWPNQIVHILPGVKHRFAGLQSSAIFEFSTHHDEADSYRVEGELSRRMDAAA